MEKGRLYSKNDIGILSCFLGQAFLKQINLHDKRTPPFSLIAINWKRNSALCNSPGFSHSKVNEHTYNKENKALILHSTICSNIWAIFLSESMLRNTLLRLVIHCKFFHFLFRYKVSLFQQFCS